MLLAGFSAAFYFEVLIITAALLITSFVLWIFFVNVMWMKRNKDKIPKYLMPLAWVFVGLGMILDVTFDLIFGTILFQQLPDYHKGMSLHDATLSHRLRKILRGESGIYKSYKRYKFALFVCRHLIEPWDSNHCGLRDIQ